MCMCVCVGKNVLLVHFWHPERKHSIFVADSGSFASLLLVSRCVCVWAPVGAEWRWTNHPSRMLRCDPDLSSDRNSILHTYRTMVVTIWLKAAQILMTVISACLTEGSWEGESTWSLPLEWNPPCEHARWLSSNPGETANSGLSANSVVFSESCSGLQLIPHWNPPPCGDTCFCALAKPPLFMNPSSIFSVI